MKEITLEQPKEVLKVNIGDKSFNMPLAGSIPFCDLMRIKSAKTRDDKIEIMVELFSKYIPEEIYKSLTSSELKQIMNAWGEASEEAGVTPGES